jgi:hypothetical protein
MDCIKALECSEEFISTNFRASSYKPEGAKRPQLVQEDEMLAYDEIKYTKYLISFK